MRKTLLALIAALSFFAAFAVTAAVLPSQVAPKPPSMWILTLDIYVADQKVDSKRYAKKNFKTEAECEYFADHDKEFLSDLQGLYDAFVKAHAGKDVELKDLECVEVPAPSIGI